MEVLPFVHYSEVLVNQLFINLADWFSIPPVGIRFLNRRFVSKSTLCILIFILIASGMETGMPRLQDE